MSAAARAQEVVRRLERAAAALATGFGWLAALAVLAIAVLLVVSSIKRYLFASPVPETEELGSLLFLALGLLSLAYGFVNGRHVRVDIVWRRFPVRAGRFLEAAGLLLAVPALAILVRETWDVAVFSFEIGARSDMSEINLWPWRMVLPLGLGMLGIVVLLRAAAILLALATGTEDRPSGSTPGLPLH